MTTLGRPATATNPGALRVFMTASFFFEPSLPVEEAVEYVGLEDDPSQNFAAFRCKPRTPNALDAQLATWPNLFHIFEQDFATRFTCPAGPTAPPENQLLCIAEQFTDMATTQVTVGLADTFDVARQIFESPTLTDTVRSLYGIFPAFSGLGYAIKGSGDDHALTVEQALRNAIAPEYTVKNVTLAEGGCRCILVPPYPGRSSDPVDPDFVWEEGGSQQCRFVDRLRKRGPISAITEVPDTTGQP